ncbi:MAG: biotin/lipoyl-binding protein [Anaerolineae bacterium]|jgi:biotin carboxyl carrier protein
MKRYQITINGHTFDVQVLSDPRQAQVQVSVDGEPLTVDVQRTPVHEQETAAATSSPASAPTAPPRNAPENQEPASNRVTSPLPGVIKSVKVEVGQEVAPGDRLLVIEAMKMDNVIRAVRAGAIATVYAVEGHQVAHGEPLLEYEA